MIIRVQDSLEKRRGTSATLGWVISHVYKKWYRETRALEGDVIPCRYLLPRTLPPKRRLVGIEESQDRWAEDKGIWADGSRLYVILIENKNIGGLM